MGRKEEKSLKNDVCPLHLIFAKKKRNKKAKLRSGKNKPKAGSLSSGQGVLGPL